MGGKGSGRRRGGPRVLGPYRRRDDGRVFLVLRRPSVHGRGTVSTTIPFPSLKEAQRAKPAIAEGLSTPGAITLEDAILGYQCHLRESGRKESTVREAWYRLGPLLKIVGEGDPLLDEVRRQHVEQRLEGMTSVATRKGTLARMVHFFEWTIKAKYISKNPAKGIEVLGRVNKGKPTLTRMEARRLDSVLWDAVESDSAWDQEAALAILVLLYCGLRVGELLRLQVRDLDLDSKPAVLSVERSGKTVNALRDMEVPEEIVALLKPRISGKEPTAWLWASGSDSGHREPTWLLKRSVSFCKQAGVQRMTPQGLRATHARLSREAGVTSHVIANQLGHSNTRVTRESYIGQDVDERAKNRQALKVIKGGDQDGEDG